MRDLPVIETFAPFLHSYPGGNQMNVSTHATKTGQLSSATAIAARARHYLGGRRGLIVLAVIVIAAGLFLSWGWLAAAGIAPILLALAPCAAMCALGVCMNKMGNKSCSSESSSAAKQKAASAASSVKTGS
jgi:hypothetical protein